MQQFRRHFRVMLALSPLPALIMFVVNLQWRDFFAAHGNYIFTGMLQGDQPSYTAWARSVFTRGNGLFFANPFDFAADAPRVILNFAYSILAVLIRLCGDHPAAAWEVWRLAWGTLAFALWAVLVRRLLHGRGMRWWAWLAGAFGGGLSWVLVLWYCLQPGSPGWLKVFSGVEANYGWWCLNFFRQSIYPLELCYHALFLAALLLYIARRRAALVLLFVFIWGTHPITAMLTTSIVGFACAWEVFFPLAPAERPRNVLLLVGLSFVVLAATLYYRVYLPTFPSIADWIEQTLSWVPHLAWRDYIPAYGVLLASAAVAVLLPRMRRWLWRDAAGRLVLLWGLLDWAWSNNDLVLFHPIQPLHFMRGHLYLWLVIVTAKAADLYRHELRAHLAWSPRRARLAAFASLLLLFPDNVLFTARMATEAPKLGLLAYKRDAEAVQRYFDTTPGRGKRVVFSSDQWLGVRLAMETERVYASEAYITPLYPTKIAVFVKLSRESNTTGMRRIGITHLILDVERGIPAWIGDPTRFKIVLQNPSYIVGELLEPKMNP